MEAIHPLFAAPTSLTLAWQAAIPATGSH
jgi:hypothetical protein